VRYDRQNGEMRHALRLHPDSHCVAAIDIDVEIARPRAGGLVLSYIVTGEIDRLRLLPTTAAAPADELWQHTCFEAFLGTSPGAPYHEFNFAPSTRWAAYRFGSYRSGMHAAAATGAPTIETQSAPERFTLRASLNLDGLSGLPPEARWRLGLAAVIEDTDATKSYWALAHPPGKPDFHHFDCFALAFSSA
jgi:hypothetical protein